MRQHGWWVRFQGVGLALLISAPAAAGSISIAWDPVPDPDLAGYRVYYGIAPGSYSHQIDVGTGAAATLDDLADCTTWHLAVKARDAAGNLSAAYSAEVVGMPRPAVSAIYPPAAEQGLALSVAITGANFAPGATVRFGGPGVSVSSVVVESCTRIVAGIVVAEGAAAAPLSVEVTNSDGVYGAASGLFAVLQAVPPSVASVSPASLATGVPLDVRPSVTFSEAMTGGSVTSATVRLLNSSGGSVAQAPGSPGLSADGRTATVVPAGGLDHGTTYRIQVVGGAAGVRDLANVPLASTYTQDSGFTTVPDTAPPLISQVAAGSVQATTAVVSWTTSEPADRRVFYRKAGEVSYQQTARDPSAATDHSVLLRGLAPSTAYSFYVQSADGSGNLSWSSPDGTFVTAASPYAYISMEAESGTITAPVRRSQGSDVFRGGWVDTPPGTLTGSASAPSGKAELAFHLPEGGSWRVWLRLHGATVASDTWYESVDGAIRQAVSPPAAGEWTWVAGRSYSLEEGLHSLELGAREAQARADRVLITNDPDFVPTEGPGGDVIPPAAPAAGGAGVTDGAVTLTWTVPPSDVSAVVVRYRTDGRFPESPADGFPALWRAAVPDETESFTHEGLVNGMTYSYAVFAVDGSGNASSPARIQATPVDNAPPGTVGQAWRTDRR